MEYIKQIQSLIDNTLQKKITNEELIYLYYKIGEILENTKDKNLMELEINLKQKYGIVIGFSRRNFMNMMKLYKTYKDTNLLSKLKQIPWKNHLIILKQKEKETLMDICIKQQFNIDELEHYIHTKEIKKISSLLEDNDSLKELISLQKSFKYKI